LNSQICASCRIGAVVSTIDFGLQPLCNRFLADAGEAQYLAPLVLGQCARCGLVQLSDPIAPEVMRSRFSWLTYSEPEPHLADLADRIAALPGLAPDAIICGLSSVDDSLLRRLEVLGFTRTWRLDLSGDLGADVYAPGVETIQARLTVDVVKQLVERHGRPDVVIGRYLVEHAHDLRELLETLRALIAPGGYLVLEVPDCERALEKGDYSAVWEEHVLYFSAATLRSSLEGARLPVADLPVYEYSMQNALVAIARAPFAPAAVVPVPSGIENERRRWEGWVSGFPARSDEVRRFLAGYRSRGPVAVFGAAQRACTFVNLLDLGDCVDFFVDDSPHKQGRFMPGSALPILDSTALIERRASLCLMAARQESQEHVVRANHEFLDQGGTFSSIYLDGRYALPVPALAGAVTTE
jgi:hypothetical protein